MDVLDEKEWFLLYELGRMGAFKGIPKTATSIADNLSSSQQTISRRLKSLKDKGFIEYTLEQSDMLLIITKKGKLALHTVYHNLKSVFTPDSQDYFTGYVQTGLGEGKFYIQLPEYNIQFTNLLKKPPFAGTLNILLEPNSLDDYYYKLAFHHYVMVKGFESYERSYGDVKCYSIYLSSEEDKKEVKCLLVDIKRSSHQKGMIEVVSSFNLRQYLHLIDGSKVQFNFAK